MLEKDWIFSGDTYCCDLRAAAVLVKDGKILVQRDRNGTEYALPGGHIKIGETLEDGLIREMQEETGVSIHIQRMLWSEECFWEWKGKAAHNISFYYLIDVLENCALLATEDFISQKDNGNVVLGWMPIEKLKDITIYPEFLKQQIFHLDAPIQHFITRA